MKTTVTKLLLLSYSLSLVFSISLELKSTHQHCQIVEAQADDVLHASMSSTTKKDFASMNFEFINHKGRVIDNLDVKKEDRYLYFIYNVKKGKEGKYKFCINSVNFRTKIVEMYFYKEDKENTFDEKDINNQEVMDRIVAKEVSTTNDFKQLGKDLKKDDKKVKELIDELNNGFHNHVEVQEFLNHTIEIIKTSQYNKLYVVLMMFAVQLAVFTLIIKEKKAYIGV